MISENKSNFENFLEYSVVHAFGDKSNYEKFIERSSSHVPIQYYIQVIYPLFI